MNYDNTNLSVCISCHFLFKFGFIKMKQFLICGLWKSVKLLVFRQDYTLLLIFLYPYKKNYYLSRKSAHIKLQNPQNPCVGDPDPGREEPGPGQQRGHRGGPRSQERGSGFFFKTPDPANRSRIRFVEQSFSRFTILENYRVTQKKQ